ncbi:MAG: beta-ketoacyl synthase N-terminal-like domain-containing protein [bacterium]|nr:beta-ketoacyl synthase N-terminal-like domain-containing protein [bacterium]
MAAKSSGKQLNKRLQKTPIAIVGMSALFPESKDLQSYWENILSEADCIREVPEDRWNIEDYYDPDKSQPDKTYSKQGGFIPGIEFNPIEWGLPPNILELTDVSQLLSLVMAKRALEDGGYGEGHREFDRAHTGCILGVGGGQKLMNPLISRLQTPIWEKVLASEGVEPEDRKHLIEKMKKAYVKWEEMSFPGTLGNVIAGRIANRLDLGGTNCVVDAACASSLAGIRMAISDLLEYRSDMMITGGVDTDNSIYMYLCFSKTPAFTSNEVLQPFDKNSSGIMIGEGIGMLLLKRLEDAEADGDKIYAVIKGVGSSSDGRFKSIYAPRAEGQLLAMNRAYEAAGVDPQTVGLWEAHGTGTKAGDATESSALSQFMGKGPRKTMALGSVKSQMGHTKNAAGSAGLIKVALALHHKVLPATINVTEPNPALGLDGTPVYLNTETRPWVRALGAPPRRAGISAFGFGGTNFHYVLEEYEQTSVTPFRLHRAPEPLFLHAANRAALVRELAAKRDALRGELAPKVFFDWAADCAEIKIPQNHVRLGLVATDAVEAANLLDTALEGLNKNTDERAFSLPEGIHYREVALEGAVAALFAGQGSPYLNMGKDLVWNFPSFEAGFAQMDALFAEEPEALSQVVFPVPTFDAAERKAQETRLQLTENAQPAIGVFSRGLYRLMSDAGFKADMAAGHSFGELTALWAAGVLSESDYMSLAQARGAAMKAQDGVDAGGMMAVMGQVEGIEAQIKEFKDLKAANYNSKKQVVLAGPKDQLELAATKLKAQKFSCVMLGVSAAFHTPLVGHAQKPFAQAIAKASFKAPKIPVYSNASGKAHPQDPKKIQKALEEHILHSVRFVDEIEAMYEAGARIFVEFGPQSILSKLTGNILNGKEHVCVALNASAKGSGDLQLRRAYAELKVLGLELGQLDPYALRKEPVLIKPSPASVTLTGANYVSPQTRKNFADALVDGHKIRQATPIVQAAAPVAAPVVPAAVQSPAVAPKNPEPPAMNPQDHEVLAAVSQSLKDFQSHQAETIRVHEQFLTNQNEYSRSFFAVLQSPAAAQLAAQIEGFTQHQNETLRIHENYLNHQAEFAEQAFRVIEQQQTILGGSLGTSPRPARPATPATPAPRPAPVAPQRTPPVAPQPIAPKPTAPAPTPVVPPRPQPVAPVASASVEVKTALMAVVAEKTGYQAEMLDLSMDLESDLGIDSIKRVEILYALQEKLPSLGEVNPDSLSELRTLGEIVRSLGGSAAAVPVAAKAPAVSAHGGRTLGEDVLFHLLGVISRKTGYAHEMLDPEMDLESDLGVDSIKRVEILYALQEGMPQLPTLKPEALAELRTLQQIADHISQQAGGVSGTSVAPAAASAKAAPAAQGGAEVTTALLAVVADKTGYQADMLDLSMDLESDLGIDSIKRVEILYAIQEKLPSLGEVNPEALSSLRTLGQIAEALGASAPAPAAPAKAAPAAAAPAPTGGMDVVGALMAVVAEKTGYQAEMLDLGMDLESDLGIDSIKRVEILYAIQEKLPSLGEVNPEALSSLRTLGQIAEALGASAPAPAAPAHAAPASAAPAPTGGMDVVGALMAVVAEKTGYQAEMLDLGMDLESDLGIDSIKRVEILYALQEKLPALGEVNPDALSSLRTLGQIAEQLGGSQAAAPAPAAAVAASGPGPEAEAALLAVVAEKTGYQAEMLDLAMDLESDLGIDSIKRVEILYALQEKLPSLGELNPEALSSLRTLGEIAEAVKKKSPELAATPGALERAQGPRAGRLPVSLQALAQPDRLLVHPPEGCQILLAGDPAQAAKLTKALKAAGWAQVLFLTLPGQKTAAGLKGPQLAQLDDASLAAALAEARQTAPIGGFLYLHPHFDGKDWFSDAEAALVQSVFFLAKALKEDLSQGFNQGRSCFMVATQLDGQLGWAAKSQFGAYGGGLSGLVKTLKVEWPQVFCRMVDLEPGLDPVGPILSEWADSDLLLGETGWTQKGRWTLVARKEAFNAELAPISSKEVFLVSGGAKGVTAKSVVALAQASQAGFILLGRSPLGDEPAWALGQTDEPHLKAAAIKALQAQGEKPTPVKVQSMINQVLGLREIHQTLAAIEAAGGRAAYLAADVTDPKAIQQALKATDLGPVTGLIHGAGVLADKLIEKKSFGDYEKVVGTKVGGLKALLDALDPKELKYLTLFSSSAGFYGNLGQSDYALANEVLNKAAQLFVKRYPKAKVVSFNWGPWEGGMVTPQLQRLFESRGVEVIPAAAGTAALVDEMSAKRGPNQLVIGSGMVTPLPPSGPLESYQIERDVDPKALKGFKDHSIGGKPVLPMVFALAWMAEGAAKLYPGYHVAAVVSVKVLKGVVLDQKTRFTLDLKEGEKGEQGIWLEAKLTSPGKKLPMIHYSARINLAMGPPPKARRDFAPKPGADASKLYQDKTLFHGPAFQGILEVIHQEDRKLSLRCGLKPLSGLGPFAPVMLNPLADDQALQALLVQARFLTGNASLPLSIDAFHPFAPAPMDQPFYLLLKVREADPGRLKADVSLVDGQGNVFSEMIGAEVTISENLNEKF